MNILDRWVSKKIVLTISFICLLFLVGTSVFVCNIDNWCANHSPQTLGFLSTIVFPPFVLVFLFSLITFKMKDDVFRAWRNFAVWAVPLIIAVALLLAYLPSQGGMAAVIGGAYILLLIYLLNILFFIISLVIIVYKWAQLQKKRS